MKKREIQTYTVNQLKNGQYVLVKVLNEYEDKEQANEDLINLVTGAVKEKELLKQYVAKKIDEKFI